MSRRVCHAGCSFSGEITGGGNRYPKKVPASSGRAFVGVVTFLRGTTWNVRTSMNLNEQEVPAIYADNRVEFG